MPLHWNDLYQENEKVSNSIDKDLLGAIRKMSHSQHERTDIRSSQKATYYSTK